MQLRDIVPRRWRRPASNERAFDAPVYFSGHYRVGLSAAGAPSNDRLLANVLGWHAIAARAICDRVQSLEPVVVVRRGTASTVTEEELDTHILKLLLDAPNAVFTRMQLLRVTAQWLVTVGEAYWLKVRDGLRVTRELWPLSPANVELVVDPEEQIAGYTFTADGKEITYERDEVIRFWIPDPSNPFLGVGNLAPQALAFDSSKFLDETMREHFANDAVPKVALVAGDGAIQPTSSERDRFDADWKRRYDRRRGAARGLPAILPTGFTPHEFKALGGFTENVDLMTHYRDQILMANGVPRSIVGDVADANRAAAETNQFVFDVHTVSPLADLIADTLTVRLARDYDPKLLVRFREFVAKDKAHELAAEAQDLATKVRSVNQVREDRGLEPVEWGDEPIGTIADVPYDPEAARGADLAADDPSALEDSSIPSEADPQGPRSRGLERGFFSPRREWSRVLRRERTYVPRVRSAVLSILTEQKRAVLGKLAEASRASHARENLSDLFDPGQWRRLFRLRVEPIRRLAVTETAAETMDGLGLPRGSFVFTDEVRKKLEAQGAAMVTQVNETTRRRLAAALEESAAEGASISQIKTAINAVFAQRRANAETIARTEMLRATQLAQVESFKQSGVVDKRMWNTSMDDAVRDSHQIEGEVRSLSEPFQLADGELADAPGVGAGGASLSAANAINCRCFITPVLE